MVRLILARHGKTAYNMQGRYQGQTDVPLSDAGWQQVARLAGRLAQEEIDAIYASDLQRARETALTVAAPHGLCVRAEPRLREMAFGEWEGLTYEEIQADYPQPLAAWEADPLDVAPPGGETLAQMAARVQAVLDEIAHTHSDQTVLVVGHGGSLRQLLCLALGLPSQHWQFRLDLASVSRLCLHVEKARAPHRLAQACGRAFSLEEPRRFGTSRACAREARGGVLHDGGAVLTCLNDTCHLSSSHPPSQAGKLRGSRESGRLVLVLGGARSGKSTFAQQMARELGGERVLFVATAEAGDEEMQQRIEQHRRERPAGWRVLEAPRDVGRAILELAGETDVVLVDCLTMLVSNLVTNAEDPFAAEVEEKVMAEVQALAACAARLVGHAVVISNEVGLGLVPPYPLGRVYRDLLGRANQALAREADEVYLLVAGVPVLIKGGGSQSGR